MSESKSKQVYNIVETAEKVLQALEVYKGKYKPGEHVGETGTKLDVLKFETVRNEMMAMAAAGWTPKQMAQAIKDADIFKVLGKSITQILNESVPETKPRRKRKTAPTAQKTAPTDAPAATGKARKQSAKSTEQSSNTTAAFTAKPDRDL